jgi:hypothetical protein
MIAWAEWDRQPACTSVQRANPQSRHTITKADNCTLGVPESLSQMRADAATPCTSAQDAER